MRVVIKGSVFVAIALLLVAGPASATFVTDGDPIDSGSWTQGFNETGVGPFTHMQVHMNTSGDLFEAPVFSGFTTGGWTSAPTGTPVTAWANGTATSNMTFSIKFNGASTNNPFMFTFQAWNGTSLLESADAYWRTAGKNVSGWYIETGNTWGQLTPVPEPISMVMLGCVGAGMFAARKLRRQKL